MGLEHRLGVKKGGGLSLSQKLTRFLALGSRAPKVERKFGKEEGEGRKFFILHFFF